VVIELWAVEAFVLRLLLFVSSLWLVLSVLEMQVSDATPNGKKGEACLGSAVKPR
jgi:hypothetical protein